VTLALRPSRRTGGALLAFGLAGATLILAAATLVLTSLAAVDDAVSGFERQRTELLNLLEPASIALADAGDAADRAGGSLTGAGDAAGRAAGLSSSLASSFDGLAALEGLEILGIRPFAGSARQFADVASEARALASDLTATASALRQNVADGATVAAHLRALAAQLDRLESSLRAPSSVAGNLGGSSVPITVARLVLLGLLAWLAVPAVASTWLGWSLTRGQRPQAGTART
jgi:hypothetical protein